MDVDTEESMDSSEGEEEVGDEDVPPIEDADLKRKLVETSLEQMDIQGTEMTGEPDAQVTGTR